MKSGSSCFLAPDEWLFDIVCHVGINSYSSSEDDFAGTSSNRNCNINVTYVCDMPDCILVSCRWYGEGNVVNMQCQLLLQLKADKVQSLTPFVISLGKRFMAAHIRAFS